jgi:hypothetical protein
MLEVNMIKGMIGIQRILVGKTINDYKIFS